MIEVKSIVDLTQYVGRHLSSIDDEIDRILEGYKDYTDTLVDIAGPIKALVKIYSLSKRIKFKKFIKGFSEAVQLETVNEVYINRLERYLSRQENLEHIAEIVDSSIETKSSKCSSVLGYYAGLILNETRELVYSDLVMINALKVMVDSDLKYFLLIYERFHSRAFDYEVRVRDTKDEFEQFGYPVFELENTIEKLKSSQAIGYDVGGLGNVGNAWGAFKFNENTKYMYETIKSILKEHVV
ncbi:hypothetical protein [Cohnella mopanensis]|uniref:hypothetical protein n=1 Tax=Cohnella mopanensis TaxID=2911966 RepID=UPI001EF84212|nr:hypothetical protein [Cohnella mopanensis]